MVFMVFILALRENDVLFLVSCGITDVVLSTFEGPLGDLEQGLFVQAVFAPIWQVEDLLLGPD